MPKSKKPLTKEDIDGPDPMKKALKDKDITCDRLADLLDKELKAEETKFFADKGIVTDQKDVVAWGVRQKARQDAHKLRGDYPVEKVEHTVTLEDQLRAIHEKREKEE